MFARLVWSVQYINVLTRFTHFIGEKGSSSMLSACSGTHKKKKHNYIRFLKSYTPKTVLGHLSKSDNFCLLVSFIVLGCLDRVKNSSTTLEIST